MEPRIRSKRRTYVPTPRQCKICGKEFMPINNRQIYCSHDCLLDKKYNDLHPGQERPRCTMKICENPKCRKEFSCPTTVLNRKRFCSKNCSQESRREHEYQGLRKQRDRIIAKCPCCERRYEALVYWTGNTTPRLFCPDCKDTHTHNRLYTSDYNQSCFA